MEAELVKVIVFVLAIILVIAVVHIMESKEKQKWSLLRKERESRRIFFLEELEKTLANTGQCFYLGGTIGEDFVFKYTPEGYPLSNLIVVGKIEGVLFNDGILLFQISNKDFLGISFSKHHGWLLVKNEIKSWEIFCGASTPISGIIKDGWDITGSSKNSVYKGDMELLGNLRT